MSSCRFKGRTGVRNAGSIRIVFTPVELLEPQHIIAAENVDEKFDLAEFTNRSLAL